MKALVIEDEPITAKLIAENLRDLATVEISHRPDEAFERLVAAMDCGEPFDLITLDLSFPDFDGDEFLDELRWYEIERGIPADDSVKVMVISGRVTSGEYAEVLAGVCDACLAKPVDPKQLKLEVQRLGLTR